MSKSKEVVQIGQLPGIAVDTASFCVRPDGKTAFIFDHSKSCFVEINLTDGKTRRYKTEVPKKLDGFQAWGQIRAIVRKSQTIILALIIEEKTKKCFLVSFSLGVDNISVIHEHYLGIVVDENWIKNLTTDEKEDIYVVSYDHPNERQTVFDLVKIDVDNNGNIASQILFGQHTIHDLWHQPFVLSKSINFILFYAGKNERLLSVPFVSKRPIGIKLANDNDNWPNAEGGTGFTPPSSISDRIFYYLYQTEMKKGFLVYCDWNNKCWKQVDIDMKDHVIIDWAILDHSANDGHIYLRGTCSLESCTELSHIYIFDVKNILKVESHDTVRLPVDNLGSSPPNTQREIRLGRFQATNSGVSSMIAKLNKLQPWNPKSNTSLTDQVEKMQDAAD